MRFSLRTMTSGAPSSSSRFRRLLRLMTRRYRSFRSDVAKRPPSNCTIGRSSGGITGSTVRIIHSGRLPLLRNDSTTRSRLAAFFLRCFDCVVAISARSSLTIASRSILATSSRMASAPMPALKTLPQRSCRSRYSLSVSRSRSRRPFSSSSESLRSVAQLRLLRLDRSWRSSSIRLLDLAAHQVAPRADQIAHGFQLAIDRILDLAQAAPAPRRSVRPGARASPSRPAAPAMRLGVPRQRARLRSRACPAAFSSLACSCCPAAMTSPVSAARRSARALRSACFLADRARPAASARCASNSSICA